MNKPKFGVRHRFACSLGTGIVLPGGRVFIVSQKKEGGGAGYETATLEKIPGDAVQMVKAPDHNVIFALDCVASSHGIGPMDFTDNIPAQKITTRLGEFTPDKSGLYHYKSTSVTMIHISTLIEDALFFHPEKPSWFWLNGTFCPIRKCDTITEVIGRWNEWRDEFQHNTRSLLENLERYSFEG